MLWKTGSCIALECITFCHTTPYIMELTASFVFLLVSALMLSSVTWIQAQESKELASDHVRVKRQLTLTDYLHVHNPNPGANSIDWLTGNSEIQSPYLPSLPSPPPTPWLKKSPRHDNGK